MDIFAALKILNKVIKLGDTTKIKATLDESPLDKTDVDFHLFRVDLEAWRAAPKEYFRCEFPFQSPKNPILKVNGEHTYQESVDIDTTASKIAIEIRYADKSDGTGQHVLKFEYPFL